MGRQNRHLQVRKSEVLINSIQIKHILLNALLCLDLMVQTCWSRKATFFILLLLLSFLVRDYRDSLQVIYFKPRHNGP